MEEIKMATIIFLVKVGLGLLFGIWALGLFFGGWD